MILPRCLALLGLVWGSRLVTTAIASDSVTGTEQQVDAVPSWLSKSSLRKMPTAKDMVEKVDGALDMPKLDKLTALEQINLIESFKHQMISLAEDLGTRDLSGATEDLQEVAVLGKEYTYKAVSVVEEAIAFLNKTLHLVDPPVASFASDEDLSVDNEEVSRRLNTHDHSRDEKQHHSKEYDEFRSKHKEYQKKAKAKFEQYHHFGASFQRHATKHHAEKRDKMRDAILNGDFDAAFAAFASTGTGRHMSSREHRRMKAAHGRRLSKQEQCKLLADCAGAMTMFDLFVYYYSDDIDPSKGEVDDNLFKFDESNIVGKWNTIQNAIKAVRSEGYQQKSCDSLLQLFHRTIEHGSLPEWQGASVNQICLAEGTTIFVKYMEMVKALVDQSFPDGYNSVSEKKWIEDTDKSIKRVAEKIAVEPFQCAEKLFYHRKRKDNEEFPFGGCSGKISNCSIDKYKFPVKFDMATVTTKAKKYETRRYYTKCDRGYEIKSKEQCIEAGVAVGAKLDQYGKIVSKSWNHTPCGCFISDGLIHWRTGHAPCKNKKWRYSVVCEEHRNQGDYEKVNFKTKCDPGYEIKSVAECQEAGLALGGYLDDFRVDINDWSHTPCGCFLHRNGSKRGKIHFDNGSYSRCSNKKWQYEPVCKRKKTTYKSLPRRPSCDPGFEVMSRDECRRAGTAVGGHSFKEGTWSHTPNYCFIDWDTGVVHYSRTKHFAKNDGWNYDVVCKPNDNAEKYKKIQFATQCPPGDRVATAQECEVAGQSVGGYLGNFRVDINDWSHTPCGCFLSREGKIHFDTGSTGCANRNYEYEPVCTQSQESADKSAGRDVHGKLLSNERSGFISMSYDQVKRTADSCIREELAGMEKGCLDESGNQRGSKFYECQVDKRTKAIEECDRFGPIQTALELVFGAATSPGFICGITDAIVNDGVSMPGSCCLDAPYQLDGDAWGHPYDCETSTSCKNPGPYLAGVSSEACDAHGGTWCPAKADCTVLKDCVESMTSKAKGEKRQAFVGYLEAAPEIKNPNDRNHCGRAREYFGFDKLFVNDQQICEDIEQLKYSRDFDFLDEFFNQGSGTSGGNGETPGLALVPPDRAASEKEENKKHWSWKATNFALKVSAKAIEWIQKNLVEMDCMCDPFCASENICKAVKNGINHYIHYILIVLENTVMVAQNLFETLSKPRPTVRAEENTEVLYENMQLMADYLVEMREEIRSHRELKALPGSADEPIERRADDVGGKQCNAVFEVELQILRSNNKSSSTKSIYALSTLGGALVPAEFKFSKLSNDEEEHVLVEYNKTSLEPGKALIRFGTDVDGEDFLVVQAHPLGGTGVANKILSFV